MTLPRPADNRVAAIARAYLNARRAADALGYRSAGNAEEYDRTRAALLALDCALDNALGNY